MEKTIYSIIKRFGTLAYKLATKLVYYIIKLCIMIYNKNYIYKL